MKTRSCLPLGTVYIFTGRCNRGFDSKMSLQKMNGKRGILILIEEEGRIVTISAQATKINIACHLLSCTSTSC